MARALELTGQRFGMLTVVGKDVPHRTKSGQSIVKWICKCDCGNTTVVDTSSLRANRVVSCGCYRLKRAKEANTKHGGYKDRLYSIYYKMLGRCNDPRNPSYKNYGQRGIKICKEWQEDYSTFRQWALANGYADNLSIDRIDVNGNYEPDNCRWADAYMQANNTRKNIRITYNGETHSLSEWGRIKPNGLEYETLRSRIRDGWTIDDAFSLPLIDNRPDSRGNRITINGETHNVKWWCDKAGINKSTFYRRLKRGMNEKEALGV